MACGRVKTDGAGVALSKIEAADELEIQSLLTFEGRSATIKLVPGSTRS